MQVKERVSSQLQIKKRDRDLQQQWRCPVKVSFHIGCEVDLFRNLRKPQAMITDPIAHYVSLNVIAIGYFLFFKKKKKTVAANYALLTTGESP